MFGVATANGTVFVILKRPTRVPTGPGAMIDPLPALEAGGAAIRICVRFDTVLITA